MDFRFIAHVTMYVNSFEEIKVNKLFIYPCNKRKRCNCLNSVLVNIKDKFLLSDNSGVIKKLHCN